MAQTQLNKESGGFLLSATVDKNDSTGEVTYKLDSLSKDGETYNGSGQFVSLSQYNDEIRAGKTEINNRIKDKESQVSDAQTTPEVTPEEPTQETATPTATPEVPAQEAVGATETITVDTPKSIAEFKAGPATIERAFQLVSNRYPGARIEGNSIVGVRNGKQTTWTIDNAGNIIASVGDTVDVSNAEAAAGIRNIIKKGQEVQEGLDLGSFNTGQLEAQDISKTLSDLKTASVNEQRKEGLKLLSQLRQNQTKYDSEIAARYANINKNLEEGYEELFDRFEASFNQQREVLEAGKAAKNAQILGALRGAGIDKVNSLAVGFLQSGLAVDYNTALADAQREYNSLVAPYKTDLVNLRNQIEGDQQATEQEKKAALDKIATLENSIEVQAVQQATEVQGQPLETARDELRNIIQQTGLTYGQRTPTQKVDTLNRAMANLIVIDTDKPGFQEAQVKLNKAIADTVTASQGNLTADLRSVLNRIKGQGFQSK